jgi:hypothetical protein
MASYQQHGGYRSQPTATMPHAQQQQPQWTPQLVDELLFRQFMKGEDVTALVPPPPTAPSGPLALPDSIRALQRYVMGGGSTAAGGPAAIAAAQRAAATGATGNAPGTPHRAGTPVASSSAAAAAGGARTPVNARRPNQPGPAAAAHGGAPRTPTAAESKSRPLPDVENTPPVSHNQQQQQQSAYGTAAVAGAKRPLTDSTPSSATNAGSGANAGVNPPSSPRTATTVNTNSKAHARPAESRRVAWPTDAPQDAQLKGTSRSALQPVTQARLRAQERVDPDWIFAQPLQDFPVAEIFGTYPDAAKLIKALRGISGDWRQDTFTEVEELSYKESMGYSPGAPSQANDVLQAAYGRVNGTQQANGPSSAANQLPMPPPLRQPVPAMPAASKHGALHHLDGEIGLA